MRVTSRRHLWRLLGVTLLTLGLAIPAYPLWALYPFLARGSLSVEFGSPWLWLCAALLVSALFCLRMGR